MTVFSKKYNNSIVQKTLKYLGDKLVLLLLTNKKLLLKFSYKNL